MAPITLPSLTPTASYTLTSMNSSGLPSHQPWHALNFLLCPSIPLAWGMHAYLSTNMHIFLPTLPVNSYSSFTAQIICHLFWKLS